MDHIQVAKKLYESGKSSFDVVKAMKKGNWSIQETIEGTYFLPCMDAETFSKAWSTDLSNQREIRVLYLDFIAKKKHTYNGSA